MTDPVEDWLKGDLVDGIRSYLKHGATRDEKPWPAFYDLVEAACDRIATLESRLALAEKVMEALKPAMTDSVTHDGDFGGPGCFYCNTEGGHAKDCFADHALAAYDKAKGEHP